MTPNTRPLTYAELVDAWVQRRNSGVIDEPVPGDLRQKVTDFAQRFAANREGPYDTAATVAGLLTGRLPLPKTSVSEPEVSAVTGEMGRSALGLLDLVAPDVTFENTTGMKTGAPIRDVLRTEGPSFADVGQGLGEAVPSMVTTLPLLGAGLPGLLAATGKSYAEAYTPHADPVAGAIAGTTMAALPGAMKAGETAAQKLALNFLLPSAKGMAKQAPAEFAQSVAGGLKTAVAPTTPRIVAGSRLAGAAAGATGVMETSRQAHSLAETGELAPLSVPALVGDVGMTLPGAVPLIRAFKGTKPVTRGRNGEPVFSEQAAPLVVEVMDRSFAAQKMRNDAAAKTETYNQGRGLRIADTHQQIFKTAAAGGDPTPAIGALKAHWDEVQQHTPEAGLKVLKSMADEGNTTGIPDEAFQRIVAGVQGRYADHFKNDPTLPGPETVNEFVRRGLLPKVTKEWISQNFSDAVDQLLGDYEGAKANLVNRITAHYEESLPGALEAMRARPVETGLSRQGLNAASEADKDALYINALLKLYPHMKDARVKDAAVDPKGNLIEQRLAEAMWQRDMELSAATQGNQLSSSSTAWSRYDAWKDAVIRMSETYNPQTRQGVYFPIRRQSDGSTLELPAQPTSLEDMVQKKEGRYIFTVTPTRRIGRAGSSSALRDAVEFVNEKFKAPSQVEEDLSNIADYEKFASVRRKMIRSTADEELTDDETAQIEYAADEAGLTGKERDAYIATQTEQMRSVDNPAFGVDLDATNKESYYDVALHLMNKVDRLENAELWDRYGGAKLFGKGAKSPGKFQLFKDALLARMESEMDDTGQLSVAQKRFYEAWRTNKAAKQAADAPLAKTWEEQRAQFRHALRVYWGTSTPVSMPDLFMSMLEDKPKYQAMLRGAGGKEQKSTINKTEGIGTAQEFGLSKLYRAQDATGGNVDPTRTAAIGEFYSPTEQGTLSYQHVGRKVSDVQLKPTAKGFVFLTDKFSLLLDQKLMSAAEVRKLEDRIETNHDEADILLAKHFRAKGLDFYRFDDGNMGSEPEIVVLNKDALITTPSDYDQYTVLQQKIVELGKKPGGFNSPEFQKAWAESEAIKNRHGGFPPSKEEASLASGSRPESNAGEITHEYSGFTTPAFDALRLGEAYGRRLGLDAESSKQLGDLTSKFVQAFPELAGFGEVKSNETGLTGLHVSDSSALGGPVALVNLDQIIARERTDVQRLAKFLMMVGHEVGHTDITKGAGVYRQQRADSQAIVKAMFTEIGPEQTTELLNFVEEVVLPPTMRPKTKTSLASGGGQTFENEAFSRLMEYTMLGALTKDNPWQGQNATKTASWGVATRYLPDEVQAAQHLAFRDLTNVFGSIVSYYESRPQQPKDKFIVAAMKTIVGNVNAFINVNAVKLAQYRAVNDRMRAQFAAASSVDLTDPVMVRLVHDLDNAAAREIASGEQFAISEDVQDASELGQTMMFPKPRSTKLQLQHERDLGTRVPAWSHWMALSYQTMLRFHKEGNPLAETVMYKLNDLEKAYFRLNRTMHDPFMVTDDKGRLKYDPEHPLLRIIQRSDSDAVRARVMLSDLTRWANEMGKPVVEDGALAPSVPQKLREKMATFKPADQQGILAGVGSLLKGSQEAATILFNDRVEASAARIGAVLMSVDRGMFSDKVFGMGKQIVETSVVFHNAQKQLQQIQKEPTLVAELPAAQQKFTASQQAFYAAMQGLNGDQIGAVQHYLFGKDGIAPELSALDGFFKERAEWFTTESRPGRYFIQSHKPDGTGHYTSAANLRLAKQTQQRLVAAGHTGILATDRQQPREEMFDTPDAVVKAFIEKETKAWLDVRSQMEQKLSPEDLKFIDELGYVPGLEVEKSLETKSIKRYMQQRELTSGREELDMIDAFSNYTGRLSGSVARRGLTRELGLLMQDPRLRNEGEFKTTVKTMQDTLLQPLSNGLQTVRAGLTARYLGLPNFVGPVIETLQSAQGVLPYFMNQVGFVKGIDTYRKVLIQPALLRQQRDTFEQRRILARAQEKENADPRLMTKEESVNLYYKRQQSEGGFKQGPIYASGFSRNHQILEQAAFGLGASKPKPIENQISDPLYWMAQMSMVVYSTASDYNSRVAFLGALDMLYDRGLRGQELYQGASAYQNLYTHGGGKANTVGYINKVSNPVTRSAWGLTETLQRYMFGNLTMQKDMFDEIIGRVEGATPRQRKQAAQAFATAQFVQLLLAGAMGITGVGIGAAIVQKTTGFDAKQKLREFWKDLYERLGADDPLAVQLANYSQNGFVSNSLGVDVSNRMTMNSFLGFNEYDGFNTNELTGVVSSSIEDLWMATKYVAQGNMTKAGRQLANPSMRPAIDLYTSKRDYGDFSLRDSSNNLVTELSPGEAVAASLGLKPYRHRLLRDAKQAQLNQQKSYTTAQDQTLDGLAQEMLKGNVQATKDYVQQLRAKDPLQMPQPVVSSIIDRAVAARRPQDVLATGPVANAPAQRQIAESFGDVSPRQSELQDLIMREKLNAATGYMGGPPATKQTVERAALVDALVKQRGMTRAEASRVVTLMGH